MKHWGRSVVACRSRVLDEPGAAWASTLHRLERHLGYGHVGVQAQQRGHLVRSASSGRIGPGVVEAAGCILAVAEAGAGSGPGFAVAVVGDVGVGVGADAVLLRSRSTVAGAGAVAEAVDGAEEILGLVA